MKTAKEHARTILWIEGNRANNQEEKDMLLQEEIGRVCDDHGELQEWESSNAVALADLANLGEEWCSDWAWDEDKDRVKESYEALVNRAAEIAGMTRAR